jgi:hypothetical protein
MNVLSSSLSTVSVSVCRFPVYVNGKRSVVACANLASETLYFHFPPQHTPAETLVQDGHVTPLLTLSRERVG